MRSDAEISAMLLGSLLFKPTVLEGQRTIEEWKPVMRRVLDMGGNFWIRWECPNCGQIATTSKYNTIFNKGYQHEECEFLYEGPKFGLAIKLPFGEDTSAIG